MTPSTLFDILLTHLQNALQDLVENGMLPTDAPLHNVALEQPKDPSHGDFATNAAMVLAKSAGKPPRVLAEALSAKLAQSELVETTEIAGPGFLNLRLSSAALNGEIATILATPTYGAGAGGAPAKNAIVEYVSINPTGPIHVGHGRNAVFGDAIANLLEKAGHSVWREYLVNDAGGQINVLVKSLHARYRQLFGHDVEVPENGYPGDYLIDIAQTLKTQDGDKWLSAHWLDPKNEAELVANLRVFAVNACMELIRKDLTTLGITFNRYFSEHDMHQTPAMRHAVQALRAKGLVYEGTLPPPKGKEVSNYQPVELTLFKATDFGLPEDQPIYKRDGSPTYFGQDIAYHMDKLNRGFNHMVTVIGIDQAGAFKPLAKAIEALCGRGDAYHPVPYEMVKVLRNGEPVRMSKRAGNFVLLADVLAEVGNDAFRFAMLSYKPTTQLNFDLAKAVEQTMDNPVFYVQYAHARLCSVLRQAQEAGLPAASASTATTAANNPADVASLPSPHAQALVRQLVQYPLTVRRAAETLEPHRLAFYAQSLAASVHSWYGAEKWLELENQPLTQTRLQLVQAARQVLADVLALCGVSAPTSM